MVTASKPLSYEEWLQLPEAEGKEEVVNGVIVKMPPNKLPHVNTVENLADLLKAKLNRNAVWVLTTNFGLVIRQNPVTTRTPDLAVFVKSNIVERDGYIHSAPELLIEVLSPGNTRAERAEKLQDYESLGVPEVWVLSPEAQTVEVLLLQSGRLATASILREGLLAPTKFPEAPIEISAIWPK